MFQLTGGCSSVANVFELDLALRFLSLVCAKSNQPPPKPVPVPPVVNLTLFSDSAVASLSFPIRMRPLPLPLRVGFLQPWLIYIRPRTHGCPQARAPGLPAATRPGNPATSPPSHLAAGRLRVRLLPGTVRYVRERVDIRTEVRRIHSYRCSGASPGSASPPLPLSTQSSLSPASLSSWGLRSAVSHSDRSLVARIDLPQVWPPIPTVSQQNRMLLHPRVDSSF